MNKIKRLMPIMVGTMLLTVGCGANPDKVVEHAMTNMDDIKNYTLVMDTSMVTDVEGQGVVTVNSSSETKGTLSPETTLSITDTTTLKAGEVNEKEEVTSYVTEDTEGIAYYEKQGDTWYKIVVDGMDMLGDGMLKAPEAVAEDLMEYIDEFKIVGEENVLDKLCYNIEGIIPKEQYLEALEAIQGLQDLGLNEEAIKAIEANQEELGNMVIQCFIEKETQALIQQRVDLSAMMKIGLQEAFASEGSESLVNNVECELKVSYKDINSTKAPEVPSEIYDAQILE